MNNREHRIRAMLDPKSQADWNLNAEDRDAIQWVLDSVFQLRTQCCWVCGNETGKAGRAEDSFYGDDDDGPYCEECWDEKQRQDKEREDA